MEEIEVFRALGSADRQVLLHELLTRDGTATEAELARQVAVRRHQIPADEIDDRKVDRAHARLIHLHLPLLCDLNIIEREDDTVTLVDERRSQLLEAGSILERWPPDDLLKRP